MEKKNIAKILCPRQAEIRRLTGNSIESAVESEIFKGFTENSENGKEKVSKSVVSDIEMIHVSNQNSLSDRDSHQQMMDIDSQGDFQPSDFLYSDSKSPTSALKESNEIQNSSPAMFYKKKQKKLQTSKESSNDFRPTCLKLSKNLEETKKQLENDFKLFVEGHSSIVRTVAITSDSKFIISGSCDKSIRMWSLFDRKQEATLLGHTDFVLSVGVSSDNKFVVSGSADKTIRLWNLFDKQQEIVLKHHTEAVRSVVISFDNKYIISGSDDKTVQIWNIFEGVSEAVLHGHSSSVYCVRTTSDDQFIISSSFDCSIRIWDFLQKKKPQLCKTIQT